MSYRLRLAEKYATVGDSLVDYVTEHLDKDRPFTEVESVILGFASLFYKVARLLSWGKTSTIF